MFTGIVSCTGEVAEIASRPSGKILRVRGDLDAADLDLGASVAVSGVCLTVTWVEGGAFAFDLGFETLAKTTLGRLGVGDRVNLEPSLRVGGALGGHFVLGHVDGVARIRSAEARGEALEVWIDPPSGLRRFLASKGSVALDGVSLTINDVDAVGFMVGLVPHTLEVTTLPSWRPGSGVNLEVDVLARYLDRMTRLREETP